MLSSRHGMSILVRNSQQLWLLAQDQASHDPSTDRVDDPQVPPLREELLALDDY